jgi:hypothetical protein
MRSSPVLRTRTRDSLPSSASVSVRNADTGGAGSQSMATAAPIRPASRPMEARTIA